MRRLRFNYELPVLSNVLLGTIFERWLLSSIKGAPYVYHQKTLALSGNDEPKGNVAVKYFVEIALPVFPKG